MMVEHSAAGVSYLGLPLGYTGFMSGRMFQYRIGSEQLLFAMIYQGT